MKIETDIILPHVYVLTYDTQYELCMSFVRLQEFYESPKFKDKYFTLEEFIDYWAEEFGNGSFNYPAKWNGFNLSGKTIQNWIHTFAKKEKTFRSRESELINTINDLMDSEGAAYEDIYIIGVHKESTKKERQECIEHELAHALYCLNPKYRKTSDKLLRNISDKDHNIVVGLLARMGYGKNVIADEAQAYFSTQRNTSKKTISLKKRTVFAKNFQQFKIKLKGD